MPDTNHEILATTTSVYKIDNPSPGKYVVNEQASDEAGPPDLHSQNRKELSLSTPVPGLKAVGYYDPDDKEIGLYATWLGKQIGNKYVASLDKGLHIELGLALVKGTFDIYKKGNELRFKYDITFGIKPFTKTYQDDVHLLNI